MSTLGTNPPSASGRIVVGIDGSSFSEEALRWAVGQARLTGQSIEAIITWRIPVDPMVGGAGPVMADWEGAASRTLQDTVVNVLGTVDADQVKQSVVLGPAAPTLLDASADAGLLVVGNRGRGGFRGMLLGSVTQHVVARAACPVVVVRVPDSPE